MQDNTLVIKRIYNDSDSYEVYEDNISKIELTNNGDKKTTIYKVTYDNDSILFVGLLEHEIEQVPIEEQTTIFEFL